MIDAMARGRVAELEMQLDACRANREMAEKALEVRDDRTRLVIATDKGDVHGFCLRAGMTIKATEYEHGERLLRVWVDETDDQLDEGAR